MAIANGNGNEMVMPVQPMGGYGYGYPMMGYGNSGFGGDWSGLLILFLFAAMFGGFGGGWGGMNGMGGMFPWLMAGQAGINQNTNAGFDNAAVGSQLAGIQTSLTAGFGNAEVANCGRATDALRTAYQNQIAGLERSFAEQTANTAAVNGVASQLADCCCENRLATANLSALVQSENCADREALSNGIRDIITAQTAGTQRILDTMCQDKIDAKNEKIAELQTQLNMANLASSQAAQTAALVADNTAQTQYIVNRVAPYPVPAYPAFGYGPCYGNYGGGYGGWNGNFGFNPFGNVGFGNGSF